LDYDVNCLGYINDPGVGIFYGGMVRRKTILSTLNLSLITMGLIGLQWVLFGYSLAFGGSWGGLWGGLDYLGFRNVIGDPSEIYATNGVHSAFSGFQKTVQTIYGLNRFLSTMHEVEFGALQW